MGEELAKLLVAGFIRDIKHLDWLANLVMVPKKDKSWRLCVDFKDLNKAYKLSPLLGLSWSGDWIWLDLLKGEAIRKNICWSWWTNSLSG